MTKAKKEEKSKGIQIVISVPQAYAVVRDDLRTLAGENHRTLSNYVMTILVEHVKNHMSGRIPKTENEGFGLTD